MSEPDAKQDQAALLRGLVEHQSAMLAYWDAEQRCRFANRAYQKWFGVDPATMIGRSMREFLGPLYVLNLPYIEGVLRGEPQEFEREIPDPHRGPSRHSLAQYLPDIVDGTVRGFYVLVTDVTRLKRTEAALLRVERQLHAREHLVALGTLAAGIAHEINNPLAAVTANVELALEAIASPAVDLEQVTVELNDARSAATRLRDIVHSMKLLARGDVSHEEIVNVADVLDQSIAFSRATVRYRARVQRSHQGDARVKASSSQLVQVFVNLLTNAAQAIAPSASGLIQVRSWTEGNLVAIEVIDNGCGIPTELQTRVFEPFFTTKDVGVGMGLGLSISASIIRGLGGDIACTSEAGYGSTFRVTLPRSLAPSSTSFTSARVSLAGSADDSSIPILRARVLIVDDEPGVARILARILTKICEVVMTTNSVEACQLLLDNGQDYALIFCDLMMPEMNGDVLYHRVVAARPELAQRFVMMTGGAFTAEGRAFLDSVPAPVIDKPFDVKQIRDLVRRHCASG